MTPLFEMPKLLTLSGDPFTSKVGWGDPGACVAGCNPGCAPGCIPGSGGNNNYGGEFPPDIKS